MSESQTLEELVGTIEMSSGEFALLLARCNYDYLKARLVQQLQESFSIKIVYLEPNDTSLYRKIETVLGTEQPDAVMVLGLESVTDRDTMLTGMNKIREEFGKHFHFPLILWVDDERLSELIRISPDFTNWGTTFHFQLSQQGMLDFLREKTEEVFDAAFLGDTPVAGSPQTPLKKGGFKAPPFGRGGLGGIPFLGPAQGDVADEIQLVLNDLQDRDAIDGKLKAAIAFCWGERDFAKKRIDAALEHYHQSLEFWQAENSQEPLREGVLRERIGLCYNRQEKWTDAKKELQASLEICVEAECLEMVDRLTGELGEVLRKLNAWDELETLAQQSLEGNGSNAVRGADYYSYLAEVALDRQQWEEAKKYTELALNIWTETPVLARFFLILARAWQELGDPRQAIACLKEGKDKARPQDNPQIYVNLLGELRDLLYEQGEYGQAFEVRKYRREVTYKFGLRAFIGPGILQQRKRIIEGLGEIPSALAASVRKQDIDALVARISQPRYKLTVLYGPSGVDKSFLVQAGLVPALQDQVIDRHHVLPVVVRAYGDWVKELGIQLNQALDNPLISVPNSLEALKAQLQSHAHRYLRVLIFDQFEKFFFTCDKPEERREFYQFLADCLRGKEVQFVKVILSLRDDCRNQLLELKAFVEQRELAIDILGEDQCYYLGNYSQATAISDVTGQMQLSAALERKQDIDALVARISQPRHKLTVLYGPSGVGKSSLVQGGLVPVLQNIVIERHYVLPLVVRAYADWVKELGIQLNHALAHSLISAPNSLEALKGQLQSQSHADSYLTVLIFDQFEEFFFICDQPGERREFYHFLADCLRGTEVKFVKVILSLREDYLHELLELEAFLDGPELESDILRRDQRYYLGNYSQATAISVISDLTGQTQLSLEPELVNALVEDLADELGEIRPIELQVVGAQLESKGINTLAQYRDLGDNPKSDLAKGWIEDVVGDCGTENIDAVWQLLTALTSEKMTRPLRTVTELSAELETYRRLTDGKDIPLEGLILKILVGSGLVVQWPQEPEDRYQLVHDYLVEPIRQKYNADYRQRLERAEAARKQAEVARQKAEADRIRVLKRSISGAVAATVMLAGTTIWAVFSAKQAQEAEQQAIASATQARKAEQQAMASQFAAKSMRLREQHGDFYIVASGLLAVESANIVSDLKENSLETDLALRNSLKLGSKSSKLLSHDDIVNAVSFSSDDALVATASGDNTARIWNVNTGAEIARFLHDDIVNAVSFSSDDALVATASRDNTARIWNVNTGAEIASLENDDDVSAVSFSSDGRRVATASEDGTARIWNAQTGAEIARLPHDSDVNAVSFSSDDALVATASYDNTGRIWNAQTGAEIARLPHSDRVSAVSFSSDDALVATASRDGTARIWNAQTGAEIARLPHEEDVLAVSLSSDGRLVATASRDGTARIWWRSLSDVRDDLCRRLTRNFTASEWKQYVDRQLENYRRTCPQYPVHPSVLEEAVKLAKSDNAKDKSTALAIFQRAKELQPDIDLDRTTETVETDPKAIMESAQ